MADFDKASIPLGAWSPRMWACASQYAGPCFSQVKVQSQPQTWPNALWPSVNPKQPGWCSTGSKDKPSSSFVIASVWEKPVTSASGKVYNIEMKPFWSAFMPWAFTFICSKNMLIYMGQEAMQEMNLEEKNPPPVPKYNEAFQTGLYGIAKELTQVTLKRSLERLALAKLTPQLACKLHKDLCKSATRKFKRMGRYHAGKKVFSTSMHSGLFTAVSLWLVEAGVSAIEVVRGRQSLRSFLVGCAVRIKTGGAAVFGEACGASLGTMLSPGWGTYVGMCLGNLLLPIALTLAEGGTINLDEALM